VCERARIEDGMDILDLGCGWGSMSLYLAEHYPNARIVGVSNSRTQREYIMDVCKTKGFTNLEIITCDINSLTLPRQFDRAVSIEMFEHMKNYRKLLAKIAGALKPSGLLFVHHFSHVRFPYHFTTSTAERDAGCDWMARFFFTGGTMPNDTLLHRFQDDLRVIDHWNVNGVHYSKTLEAWLDRMDAQLDAVKPMFAAVYGPKEVTKWIVRWRLFFMASSELFAFNGGNEWIVTHVLMQKPAALA
jgi:cyclopropane-fatty-acyl-phospholipid synthase